MDACVGLSRMGIMACMQTAFDPVTKCLTCQQCKGGINSRIKYVIVQWTSVKGASGTTTTMIQQILLSIKV
ncbi:hypothetical protein BDQ12DRAFT_377939 [Crucibulum laeve]|uniref:Uncharacterized protein n=1 Tax=Crucibulum laeve TaxID=68775 RepID=A0A5C3LMI7_9AGAR|nr:hypothetical protein BDQ12DRAFT_377939 [Crucibulum laeve]